VARILFVLKDSTINGLTREVAYFVRELPSVGWEPFVATFRNHGDDEQLMPLGESAIFSCEADRDGEERASERLLNYVDRIKPQIVYAYFDSPIALQRLAMLRPRILLAKAEGRKIMEGRDERRALYASLSAVFDRVVVTSSAMRDRLREFPPAYSRSLLLPSAVDTEFFTPCADKARAKRALGLSLRPVCLNVARLVSHKRPSQFLRLARAARRLAAQDERPLFIWVGGGETIGESRKRRMAQNADVTFASTQLDVRPYFDAADLFVMTSRDESAPNAMLEAMSCGLPVITTRCYDSVEELVTLGTGYVSDDVTDLAGQVVRLLAERDRASLMGRMARQHVEAHFSLSSRIERFVAEFSGV
jgi:glycosyltransferase involved in cell wall biosynthesis